MQKRIDEAMNDLPRKCLTCDHLERDGICTRHNLTPPEHFLETVDACPDWEVRKLF